MKESLFPFQTGMPQTAARRYLNFFSWWWSHLALFVFGLKALALSRWVVPAGRLGMTGPMQTQELPQPKLGFYTDIAMQSWARERERFQKMHWLDDILSNAMTKNMEWVGNILIHMQYCVIACHLMNDHMVPTIETPDWSTLTMGQQPKSSCARWLKKKKERYLRQIYFLNHD